MVSARKRRVKQQKSLRNLIGGINVKRRAVEPGQPLERDLAALQRALRRRIMERARGFPFSHRSFTKTEESAKEILSADRVGGCRPRVRSRNPGGPLHILMAAGTRGGIRPIRAMEERRNTGSRLRSSFGSQLAKK
jgi:hypothetical protein